MAYQMGYQETITAVAIDKDKNSTYALCWAIDHLLLSNPFIIIIHVKLKNNQLSGRNDVESDSEVQQLFVPFRGYCARKGIQMKEVVLEDTDVSKALMDYISQNMIDTIVLGASTRGALARKFKNYDVPTILMKSAPDFCNIYVVSKGKMHSSRKATRPVANSVTPPRFPSPGISPQTSADPAELEETIRALNIKGSSKNSGSGRPSLEKGSDPYRGKIQNRPRNYAGNLSMDESVDITIRGRNSTSSQYSNHDDPDFLGRRSMASMVSIDLSSGPGSPGESSQSKKDLEAEMKRLKLELKQTMDMYSTACKEALTAKKKADELSQWKMEESRRFEEARQAEEAALAIAEREKAKSKAAIEAAEAAQRLAELESQRRKQAEMKATKETEQRQRALSSLAQNHVRYRKYSIEEIEAATGNFSESNKIGEGGYGPVYTGKLDHTPVAIKVLRPDAAQGQKQFQQEIEVLSAIRHPNMVLLLGACPDYGCLVYEHMNRGSLEDRLLRKGNSPPISWRNRFRIAAEIATALLFLHQTKPEPLVHRDLKPANILLDRNFVSKISDVGLARLVPASVADNVTQYHMTSAAGTFCYIDPEYQQTGMLTTKSDIYSLGIMLLQIITARSPMGIAHHVRKAIEKGNFETMLDPTVSDWPIEEALAFAKLSLQCAELRKKDRPDLGTVVVPELNRLRDLGRNNELYSSNGHSYSHGHSNASNRSGYNGHSRNHMTCSPISRTKVSNQSGEGITER